MTTNNFDYSILSFVNQFCGRSVVFDRTVLFLSNNDLFKGCVLMSLYIWAWYKASAVQSVKRQRIVTAIYSTFIAMFVVRIVSKAAQFRTRPILDPNNHLKLADGFDLSRIPNTHNSFPSDHATLFFALATGMFFVSRRLGFFSLFYVLLFIAFPRVYLGLHYPTDILAGAAIGIFFVLIANIHYLREKISDKLLLYADLNPPVFYTVFFLLGFQIATLFDSSRDFLHFLGSLWKLH